LYSSETLKNNIMSYEMPKKDHRIDLKKAKQMTKHYRANKKKILAPGIPDGILPNSETFSKDAVLKLLSHPRAAAFRVYYSMAEDLSLHALLVAADETGTDILPLLNAAEGGDDNGDILDEATRCPLSCPPPSELSNP
jgi:hypothetical protein